MERGDLRGGLSHFRGEQFYTDISFGSQKQTLKLIVETGSRTTWISRKDCVGCPTSNFFKEELSTSFFGSGESVEIYYPQGNLVGDVCSEKIYIPTTEGEVSIYGNFVLASNVEGMENYQMDGVLGLLSSRSRSLNGFIDNLEERGIIDSLSFTMHIGSEEEESYIDFGRYQGDTSEIFWSVHPNNPFSETNFPLKEFIYKNTSISLIRPLFYFDTGCSILGFNRVDLSSIFSSIAPNKQLFYFKELDFYGVKCESIDEFYDLEIDFYGYQAIIQTEEYVVKKGDYCIFLMMDLGTQFLFPILGISFLRGHTIINDLDNGRIGFLPQKIYYPPRIHQDYSFTPYILIGVVLGLATVSFIVWYFFIRKQKDDTHEEEQNSQEMSQELIFE